MSTIKGTISRMFVDEALHAARLRGVDVAALLAQAGIDAALPGSGSHNRVSPQQYGALWHGLAAAMDDEFFGMDSRPMRYGSFAILCHALLDCRNLGHALDRAIRFFSLILDDMHGSLVVPNAGDARAGDAVASITLTDRRAHPSIFAHGTYFVILHGLACWLTGRRLHIVATRFCQGDPDGINEYRTIFGRHLLFGQPQSALMLEAAALALPIVRDGPAATAFLRQAPATILVKYRDKEGQVARIRRLLAATPFENWPTLAQMADSLGTSSSSLRRHLDEEGTGYQAIKDALRRDKAIDLLCNTGVPVEAIAANLGFQEISAFYKAFRKWTGAKPGDYRTPAADTSGKLRYSQF